MGYRSDTAFYIEFDTADNAQAYWEKGLSTPTLEDEHPLVYYSKHDCLKQEDDQKFILFHCASIKWYDSYPDIKFLTKFYKESEQAPGFVSCLFLRLGEDHGDVEEQAVGDIDWDILSVRREIEINL